MIEVFNISKKYGSKQVLTDVSFTAENGFVTGFVGPNGAGKSTTMRMIGQLETPDSGRALVDGQEFAKARQPLQVMGIYLGSDYLPSHMTGQAYLEYVCRAGNVPKEKIPQLLQAVELTGAEGRKISSYSLGMKQRMGLAAAIAGDANTLMLDEPVNGLDPMGVQWLRNLLRSQAAQGKAVLLSSHLLSELEVVADKIVMLDQGRIVSQGYINDLKKRSSGKTHVVMHTSDDAKVAACLQNNGVPVKVSADYLSVTGLAPDKLAEFVIKGGLALYMIEEKQVSLEEMFMATAAAVEGGGTHSASQMQTVPPQQPEHASVAQGGGMHGRQ